MEVLNSWTKLLNSLTKQFYYDSNQVRIYH